MKGTGDFTSLFNGIALFSTLLLSGLVYAEYPDPTDNCGPALREETTMYFQAQEFGYNTLCETYEEGKREQIFLQQFKPPTLPYSIEEVCGLLFIDKTDAEYAWANMYVYSSDPNVDATKEPPRPYKQIGKSKTKVFNRKYNGTAYRFWYSASLANPVTVWNETVWVGFGWDVCTTISIWRNYARPGEVYNSTPWYLKPPAQDEFVLHTLVDYNDREFDRRGTLAFSVFGSPAGFEKEDLKDAGWTCDENKYKDGSVCNCGCGIPDPDCTTENAVNPNGCVEGSVCLYGKCVLPMWDKTRCDIANYHDGKDCDCGCGGVLLDPDCFDAGLLPVCRVAGAICNTKTYVCEGGWTCDPAEYNDGVCTCRDCGIEDPDCADDSKPNDCSGEFEDFVCVNHVCRYPRAYSCPGHTYNDGRTCNCNCTVPDPDCDTIYSSIVGCPSDDLYSCGPRSNCIPATCGNDRVDPINNEECDGGEGCTECRCIEQKGYKATDPPSKSCVPICGDGRVRSPEECEVGYAFCNESTCRCLDDHPYNPEIQRCSGCGNNVPEPDIREECDGGEGCLATCLCGPWYVPFDPPSRGCQQSNALTGIIVGCILAAVIIILATVLLVLYLKKWRHMTPRQPAQGNDVVIMQVDENGMIKVSTQNPAGTQSVGPEPGSIQPGTVQGLQANALASAAALQASSTVPTATAAGVGAGTASVNVGTMTDTEMFNTATASQAVPPPPEYTGTASAVNLDSAYAETLDLSQLQSGAQDPSMSQTQTVPDAQANPALAETVFIN